MLSKVCATVIPFLLGALMFVEDGKEWNFGPEYVFKLTKSIKAYMTEKYSIGERITAVVKCRQNVLSQSDENILFCNANHIFVTYMSRVRDKNWKEIIDGEYYATLNKQSKKIPDQLFKIEFSKKGVQNFTLKTVKRKHYNIITDIIDQFNMGINLSIARHRMESYQSQKHGPYVTSFFTNHQEKTTRAIKCNTSETVKYTPLHQHNKDKTSGVQNNKKETKKTNFHFQLGLLPICDKYPASETLVIDRIRNACTHQRQNLRFFNAKWKLINVTKYSNRINIQNKKPKFSSHTHVQGNVFFPMNQAAYTFDEDAYFHLIRIKAARKELNTFEYE
ncbi:uncharacterized protein [Linepithema humile]|uniref:uncharacterized protein n=1 Tax=Linepithema humile TaxID=83485 RepID=UPI00351E0AF9